MEVRPGYKQTEVGVIPEEWEVVLIGNIASFASGNGISVAELEQQSPDTPIPVYGGNGIAGYTTRPLVKESVVVVGRVGQKCGEVYLTQGPAWITDNALYPRIIFRKVDIPFLALAMKMAGLNDVKNRNDLPLITQSILHSVCIPLPPTLAEQEAIAEALSDADAFIESLERLIAKKRLVKQGAMQELLTGKKRLPGFSGEWKSKTFGMVLKFQVGFPFSSSFFNEEGDGIRLIRNRDLKSDDQVFYYSESYDPTFLVKDGDVLVGMDGDFLPCLWQKGPALLNQRVGRIISSAELDPVFAFYYLIEPLREIENATSCTTVKHLSHRDVENITKPLPSLPEQTAIAAILSDMDAEITALEAKLDKARQIKQGMMQELLTGRIRLV